MVQLSLSKGESNSVSEKRSGPLGLLEAKLCEGENFFASRHALEQRYPYRDRRLIEYVLALPAYQLRQRGFIKYILRLAMQDILPDVTRTRIQPTRLLPLFFRGIERESTVLQAFFQDPDAQWRRFIRAEWLQERWNTIYLPEQDGAHALVPWLCISFDTWQKSAGL
jgi:asparagine synthase (glutamine-hydrolysing)